MEPVGLSTWDITEFTGFLGELPGGYYLYILSRNEMADLIFNPLLLRPNVKSQGLCPWLLFSIHSGRKNFVKKQIIFVYEEGKGRVMKALAFFLSTFLPVIFRSRCHC